jgi:catechol 2,3-dioxygenase-like lactoylglutathione lyase family enzyme
MAKKRAGKKTAPRKAAARKSRVKRATAAKAKPAAKAAAAKSAGKSELKLAFNHAMVYARDVERSLGFYRDLLGMKLLDEFKYEGKPVYARLIAPGGDGTIAIHQAGPGAGVAAEGVRLYFEIRELDTFCQKLKQKGIYFTQMPQMMPWGWRHAYLDDPDGHEISLYWAGENRMKKTVMSAAKRNA